LTIGKKPVVHFAFSKPRNARLATRNGFSMEATALREILRWNKGRLLQGSAEGVVCRGVTTDSRTIRAGELFVALRGERFDGHAFLRLAATMKAAAVIVDRPVPDRLPCPVVRVADTLKALGDTARGYRLKHAPFVIAVTGSDGKTTTREIVKAVLAARYPVAGTTGNFNNHIGLPLSLFSIGRGTKFCVVEMGMNHPGEIAALCRIALPDAGIITTVGSAHRGFFPSLSAIADAKGELLYGLKGRRLALLNRDNRFYRCLAAKVPGGEVVSFGLGPGADVRGRITVVERESFRFSVTGSDRAFRMNFWNPGWVVSGLAGITVGRLFGVDEHRVADLLESFSPVEGRGGVVCLSGIDLIDETYNSNPSSLKNALHWFARRDARRRIAVIGDMAELGRYAGVFHYAIGRYIRSCPVDRVYCFGEKAALIARALPRGRAVVFSGVDALNEALAGDLRSGDAVLVKGSRIMRMERIVRFLDAARGG